jgi:putative ABC transport system permease protein
MRLGWLEYLNAFRNVTRQYRRSLFGISAVGFGVVALLLAAGFIEWVFWAAREGAIQTGLGHIHVTQSGYLDRGLADPWHYLLPQQSPNKEAISRFQNVRTVAPRLAFNGLSSHGESTVSFVGEGVDPDAEDEVSSLLPISAGHNLSNDAPKSVVMGRGLAENLGVRVGDAIVLLANTSKGGINAVECSVRGIFTTASKAYDDSTLRLPIPLAQKLLRVSGSHRWVLQLNDTGQVPQTTLALREKFQDSGLEFIPWYDMADFYNKMVALLSKQIGVVELIIAIIIVLSISNTMMMNVLERTAEIGTCLAIGRRRSQILRQFVFEGLTVGLIGGVLGVIIGVLLGYAISTVGIPMPPPPGMSQGYTGRIMITGPLVLNAFLLAISTTLLASFYPAWKASRLEIVDALRHNR